MATLVTLTLPAGGYVRPPALALPLVLGGSGGTGPEPEQPPGFAGQPTRLPWGHLAHAVGGGAGLGWQLRTAAVAGGPRLAWRDGGNATTASGTARLPWRGAGGGIGAGAVRMPWGTALRRFAAAALPWQEARRVDYAATLPWQPARRALRGVALPWGLPRPLALARALPWGVARLIIGPARATRGAGGEPSPVLGWLPLQLCRPLAPDRLDLVLGRNYCLGWGGPGSQRFILPRRAYVRSHSVSIVRLPDLAPLQAYNAQWGADAGNFGWQLSFTGPPQLLEQLAPVAGLPRLLRVELDGLQWEFAVDRIRRNRGFGDRSVTVQARSLSMLLGEPYRTPQAYLNVVPMTAQQVLQDALQFTGVGLDWQAEDWLLPEGVWSFTGTPLAAVRRVADAIRGVVASPRTGSTVTVAPRYAVAPWEWGTLTPDVVIALDAVVTEGYERQDRAEAEGIYISGQQQGVLALVRRTGTGPAADKLLPLETDALITELVAARQRGIARLGEAGPQVQMQLLVPVLTGPSEPGVIDPGELVEVPDPDGAWRGLVRGVQVAAQWDDQGVLVEQSLTVERHL